MKACTFFGHRLIPSSLEPILRSVLIDLIENNDVKMFYVGNHGEFDAMVRRVLRELSNKYQINYYVVLAYMPEKKLEFDITDYSKTILPEGIENVPKRFAINYRNKWMIKQSDFVVTYVVHNSGSGAAHFKEFAARINKAIIELSLKLYM